MGFKTTLNDHFKVYLVLVTDITDRLIS